MPAMIPDVSPLPIRKPPPDRTIMTMPMAAMGRETRVTFRSRSAIMIGARIATKSGATLLWVALANGIYIPNLCAIREGVEPAAACRLCFVEIAGREAPVTACTEEVTEGMVVNTRGEEALRLARTWFQLLMSSHPLDCAHCAINGSCELQRIAHHLGVRLKSKFRELVPEYPVDNSSPLFIYDPRKCVLCGRCVWMCREEMGTSVLGFAHRGFDRVVTTFDEQPIGESPCQACGQCVSACPAGALVFRSS